MVHDSQMVHLSIEIWDYLFEEKEMKAAANKD